MSSAASCAALAGVILASRLQTGAPEAGLGEEFDVIAAVIIGGASLFGGRGTMIGTLIGTALITVLAKGQTLIGIPSNYQSFTRGVVILIAVVVDVLSQRGPQTSRRLSARMARTPPWRRRAVRDGSRTCRSRANSCEHAAGAPGHRAQGSRSSRFAPSMASISTFVPARCMRSSARTAPARAR